jgi:hypothetical protein
MSRLSPFAATLAGLFVVGGNPSVEVQGVDAIDLDPLDVPEPGSTITATYHATCY